MTMILWEGTESKRMDKYRQLEKPLLKSTQESGNDIRRRRRRRKSSLLRMKPFWQMYKELSIVKFVSKNLTAKNNYNKLTFLYKLSYKLKKLSYKKKDEVFH
jgi:hypothetical protein